MEKIQKNQQYCHPIICDRFILSRQFYKSNFLSCLINPFLEYSLYLVNHGTFSLFVVFIRNSLRLRHWVDVLKHAFVSRTWCSVETGDRVGRCRCLSKLKLYDSIYCFLCRFQLVNKRILDTNGLKSKFDALCAMQTLSVNNSNFYLFFCFI